MMYAFFSGAIAMGCWVSGLFFFGFYSKTHEKLFGIFGLAFWILGIERSIPMMVTLNDEPHTLIYLIRLAAFALILYAIVDKNRSKE